MTYRKRLLCAGPTRFRLAALNRELIQQPVALGLN
jgi:hypothetical protein